MLGTNSVLLVRKTFLKISITACYKNWSASSSEMETDIILEGFLQAERVPGIRYTTIIGDGDRSAYLSLIQNVPGWGALYSETRMCKSLL